MKNLACNLTKQKKEHQKEGTKLQKKLDSKDEEINDERRKNQERSELPTVISHLRSFTNKRVFHQHEEGETAVLQKTKKGTFQSKNCQRVLTQTMDA